MGTDIHGVFQTKKENNWIDIPSKFEYNRHYLLFAWIGNVRNGYGFAGVPTHTPIIPLSDNRGFPDDFEVVDNTQIWLGDHSHSWLSSTEILSAQIPCTEKTGIISKKEYDSWDCVTEPESYCGGISGRSIVVNVPTKVTEKTTHVSVIWKKDLAQEFSYFIDEVKRLVNLHGEIRFIFGFDS